MTQLDKDNLLKDLPVAIIVLDAADNCVFANSRFENLAFLKPGAALNQGWTLNFHQKPNSDLLIEDQNIHTFYSDAHSNTVRFSPFKEEGGLRYFTATQLSSSIYNKGTMSEEIKLLQNMLDFTDALLYSCDLKGNIIAFNDAASQAVKLRTGTGIKLGDYWPDLVSGADLPRKVKMEGLLRYVLNGNSYNTIESVLGAGGTDIVYSVQASPILNGANEVIGAVLCAHNITVQTQLQNEAADKALARTKELEEWNHFYDMLLSVLAHDLRQPFAVMIMKVDIIRNKQYTLSPEMFEETLVRLRDTSVKSIDLLQGLLHWVKSKRIDFKNTPEILHVKSIITEANGLYLSDQENRNLSLGIEVDETHTMLAHHQMILFVFRNLINNATKFASQNGHIKIWSLIKDDMVTICFQNDGVGMSEEQMGRLFSFAKSQSKMGQIEGAGMALAVAQDMVKQMRGNISVSSVLGQGTTFELSLPRS